MGAEFLAEYILALSPFVYVIQRGGRVLAGYIGPLTGGIRNSTCGPNFGPPTEFGPHFGGGAGHRRRRWGVGPAGPDPSISLTGRQAAKLPADSQVVYVLFR